ncbi:MAG: Tfp pilus assembly protein FimT/FimU [Phycisphaerales bacterium]
MQRPRLGISVIQVLVVLAVLASVAAIITPAVSHASRQARVARCTANLQALSQLAYAHTQSDGHMPEHHPDSTVRCPVRRGEYLYALDSEPKHLRSLVYLEGARWTLIFAESERRHGPRLGARFEPGSVGPIESLDE